MEVHQIASDEYEKFSYAQLSFIFFFSSSLFILFYNTFRKFTEICVGA